MMYDKRPNLRDMFSASLFFHGQHPRFLTAW